MPESDEEEAEPLCAISTVDTNSTTVNVVRLAMQLHCLRGINLSLCDPFIFDAFMLPPSVSAECYSPLRSRQERDFDPGGRRSLLGAVGKDDAVTGAVQGQVASHRLALGEGVGGGQLWIVLIGEGSVDAYGRCSLRTTYRDAGTRRNAADGVGKRLRRGEGDQPGAGNVQSGFAWRSRAVAIQQVQRPGCAGGVAAAGFSLPLKQRSNGFAAVERRPLQ